MLDGKGMPYGEGMLYGEGMPEGECMPEGEGMLDDKGLREGKGIQDNEATPDREVIPVEIQYLVRECHRGPGNIIRQPILGDEGILSGEMSNSKEIDDKGLSHGEGILDVEGI